VNLTRDSEGVAHIVGLSGGKDSTALAFWLRDNEPRPYNYVITPTGDELPEMFAHWQHLSRLLASPLVPILGGTLKSVCRDEGALPNFRMRFCTRRLKIEPFKAMLLTAIPCVTYIGLRADEDDREGADYSGDATLSAPDGVRQRYPLREIGWGVGDVLGFLASRGIVIPDRTDCARCFFQRLGEWYVLWRDHADIYADAERDEFESGHTYRSPGRDTWPAGLKELRQEFERGRVPEVSLRMMEKRKGMCRVCQL
jgi:3'-phosphoadenosine 5'-phosphosulfate sulfotransferase (PAPS reductase)/FAD synthetase